jgi:RimJ/RimL family protein N-acetyltransferase
MKTRRSPVTLRSKRLILRPWRDADLPLYAALNADPRVMQHFPGVLDRVASDAEAERFRSLFDARGWGFFAVEIPGTTEFAGFVGLSIPRFEAEFTPCVEVGWRLAHTYWGSGYATEAARTVLGFGFEALALEAVVSFTTVANRRSQRVMEKLGMTHDPADDFDHPSLPKESLQRRHVLYRLTRQRWEG